MDGKITIDVSKDKTVYIQITSNTEGSQVAMAFAKATRMDMVFCRIVKREYIENDVLKSISI